MIFTLLRHKAINTLFNIIIILLIMLLLKPNKITVPLCTLPQLKNMYNT